MNEAPHERETYESCMSSSSSNSPSDRQGSDVGQLARSLVTKLQGTLNGTRRSRHPLRELIRLHPLGRGCMEPDSLRHGLRGGTWAQRLGRR